MNVNVHRLMSGIVLCMVVAFIIAFSVWSYNRITSRDRARYDAAYAACVKGRGNDDAAKEFCKYDMMTKWGDRP